jgi:hypothetical protein
LEVVRYETVTFIQHVHSNLNGLVAINHPLGIFQVKRDEVICRQGSGDQQAPEKYF